MGDMVMTVDMVVIGAGPAGCAAAFRGAELGLDVALIDAGGKPGGNYLHNTCIPAKIYYDIANQFQCFATMNAQGVFSQILDINFDKLLQLKEQAVRKQEISLTARCKDLGILLVGGTAFFENATSIRLKDSSYSRLKFKHAVIATGSSEPPLPNTRVDTTQSKIKNLTEALHIDKNPGKVLITGSGPIALELGCLYTLLGGVVDLATMEKELLGHIDDDLAAPFTANLPKLFNKVLLDTTLTEIVEDEKNVQVTLASSGRSLSESYDTVICLKDCTPNSYKLGLENTEVKINEAGYILTDEQQRTGESNIFVAGDVSDSRMIGCIAESQGKIAAEVICGKPSAFDARATPTTIYTVPLIAWCGLTEKQALKEQIEVTVQTVPWTDLSIDPTSETPIGLTKIIADKKDGRILGIGITGPGAQELISEGVLAIEMGALVEDLACSLHPYTSFAATLQKAAALFKRTKT